jgi:negative regulator of flagellin synthesis FlgM
MERRRDLATQKTLASEVGVEERKANHAKRSDKSGSRVDHQAVLEKQAQVQHALKAVYRSPEVRAEKINALRAQIEAGTYQINSTSLAMKLLGITEQDAG